MRVLSVQPGRATVEGRGQHGEVDTALVGDVLPGDWLLVFLGAAREVLDETRAAEVNSLLDLLEAASRGQPLDEPDMPLPSRMTSQQLAALAGTTSDFPA